MRRILNADLSAMNTFRMRVRCACLVEYDSPKELSEAVANESLPRPFFHIGGGSNLLFTKDFAGTVLHSRIRFIQKNGLLVRVGSGTSWDSFCQWASDNDLWGPENLSHIPGEVGAAAVQNIGAYGSEVKDFIESVECYDVSEDRIVTMVPNDCGYAYRDSFFKGKFKGRFIVTAVSFTVSEDSGPVFGYGHVKDSIIEAYGSLDDLSPSMVRKVITDIRRSKLPEVSELGSAGSFFRNPFVSSDDYDFVSTVAEKECLGDVPHFVMSDGTVKIPAAWLIEKCGWKGFKGKEAGVYDKQPLVLVNLTGNAMPNDVLSLEEGIVASVKTKFGVTLRPEVEHI